MLRDLQTAFRAAILDDDPAIAAALVSDGIPADRRLGIYRTNTFGSLTQVLKAAYPVVFRLVGDPFFRAMTHAHIRAHPPRRPHLLSYGGDLPAFIAAFAPARPLPYLPDVARLEWARNEAYFAADAPPLDAAGLQRVPLDEYPKLTFALHPAIRLVASPYPIQRIWEVNQTDDDRVAAVDLNQGGQRVVVARRRGSVIQSGVGAGEYALLLALSQGRTLQDAAAAAMAAEADFQLQPVLAAHLAGGTFAGVADGDPAPKERGHP
ncbi:MAG: HvfC/BufC family peptide modification chaperone [Inquilinaceae bacterium]